MDCSSMTRLKKYSSPEFIDYQRTIIEHPNYIGLDYAGSWVKAGKSSAGKIRKKWADKKINDLNIVGSGVYAKLMYKIHPFKEKPCQICGLKMSLDYIYPNKKFSDKLINVLNINKDEDYTIKSIYDIFIDINPELNKKLTSLIRATLKNKDTEDLDTPELIKNLIEESRLGLIKSLGPGAMSNFPDRFDGFHSYNRCCRSTEDGGRSVDNLKSYSKDRRAYEAWSDGNHRAANQLMGDKIFLKTGLSADHLGPISLGFIHDPRFMKVMTSGENSAKRDRLILSDLIKIINIEEKENINASSWFCRLIWEEIKKEIIRGHYILNHEVLNDYQIKLKRNKDLFFKILANIASNKNGVEFLTWYLGQRYKFQDNYLYNYKLETDISSENFGSIKLKTHRNITARANGEESRAVRIGLESINDYVSKENRKINEELNEVERKKLDDLVYNLSFPDDFEKILAGLKVLMTVIQIRILGT